MPRKKGIGLTKKLARKKPLTQIRASKLHGMIRSIRWTESYTSLLMGVIVVIVAVLFVVSFLRQAHHIQDTSSTSTVAPTVTGQPSEFPSGEKTYVVKSGDDLWHIAEKYYKSGYNWVDIARANNLSDPSMIFSGNTLIIPKVTPQPTTIAVAPASKVGLISGDSYTVQKGDDLWHIALRAYADGYQWVKIAQANNLSDPNLIFSGNVLKIPR